MTPNLSFIGASACLWHVARIPACADANENWQNRRVTLRRFDDFIR
ncbi:hypothetical protein ACVDG5_007780 [Mesorhizobium sp. ORM6]